MILRSNRHRALTVLIITAGLTVSGLFAPRTSGNSAAAATASVSYVNNASGANCSDSGGGSQAQPFCTIGAASKAARPGQTVIIEPGWYPPVTISAAGTADQPITFLGANDGVSHVLAAGAPIPVVVSGARYVVISGFYTGAPDLGLVNPAIKVTDSSSNVTINGSYVVGHAIRTGGVTRAAPAIEIGGTASDVTVSRDSIAGSVAVDAGASGVIVTGNTLDFGFDQSPGLSVTDAPGAVVTGNTLVSRCAPGIQVAGTSPGVAIENNIVAGSAGCPTPATAISISAGSIARAVTDYNVIDPRTSGPLYNWDGTSYSSLADFQAASGQGGHDIAANPKLGGLVSDTNPLLGYTFWYQPAYDSPAVDSANPSAPGALARDQLDNPRADDPYVSNPGAGYLDRGAVELQAWPGSFTYPNGTVSGSGPLTVTAHQQLTSPWTTNGPIGIYVYDFGDGSARLVTTSTSSVQHTYRTAGLHTVTFTEKFPCAACAPYTNSANVVVGAAYTAVTPKRVLDTRTGTGVAKATAVPAHGTLTLAIPGIGGVSAADFTAVVMNVTVTQPTRNGWLAAYPTGSRTSPPTWSNLDFAAGQTVSNLVTVQVAGGKVSFYNGSGGTVQVIADLAGFYGPGGLGFQPKSPVRVLDTRTGTGAAKRPVASGTRLRLNLAGKVPADTAAVVLNVTVTQPTGNGWLAAYPDTTAKPGTSSLNFTRGQTVANQVIVPLNGAIVDLYNGSPGSAQVIADLDGYFSASAPDVFVPYGPARIMDTRTDGVPIPKSTAHNYLMQALGNSCSAACPQMAAVVANVTVTQPARNGYLTVYPAGQVRPQTSTLNFLAGQTVPNLVTSQTGNAQIAIYNSSSGSVQVIVDEFGYYMPA